MHPIGFPYLDAAGNMHANEFKGPENASKRVSETQDHGVYLELIDGLLIPCRVTLCDYIELE
jgi:hypothetical protein